MCPDGTCLFADVAQADFWAQDYSGEFSKLSRHTLVLQRTEKGRKMLETGVKEKLLKVRELPPEQESRRLVRVFTHKRSLCNALIAVNRRKKKPYPEYNYRIASKIKKHLRVLWLSPYYLLRKPRQLRLFRKLFLRFFFSESGLLFSRLNALRRKVFFKYN